MLVLSRKVGEGIVIAGNIEITVIAIEYSAERSPRVKLGITAPREVPVVRPEAVSKEPKHTSDT